MAQDYITSEAQVRLMEHDSDSPETRKVSIYGYDSANTTKRRVVVDSEGNLLASSPLPTAGNNPSLALEYTGDNLTKLTKTIDGTSYEKTLSYTGSDLTGVSSWVEV